MKRYYLCGPTVYNKPHIGNYRPIMTFDILIRAKRFLGEEIYFLHNITDIDDKIINKALEENKTEKEIAKYYEEYYLSLFKVLNIAMPTKLVRVTEHLNDMYEYIQEMLDNGSAYQIGTNVYFDVKKYENEYGKVSNQVLANLVKDSEDSKNKRYFADFALWKDTEVGVKYDSPFGKGRPGWHTECSCFINKYFKGETLDVHGGGIDLIFPHHENENIQHFAINKKPIANTWLHFGTINYNNEKMSKSLGNIINFDTYLEKYLPDSYRLLMLTVSYSKPISVTDTLLESINSQLKKFISLYNKVQLENIKQEIDLNIINEILNNVSNLDFAIAYKKILNLFKDKNKSSTFFKLLEILGFVFINNKISQEDKTLYLNWKELVNDKKYDEADKIRNKLIEKGIL